MEHTELTGLLAKAVHCHGISYGFHLSTEGCLSVPMNVCMQASTSAGSDLHLILYRIPRSELW